MTGPTSSLSDNNFTAQVFYQCCVQIVQILKLRYELKNKQI